VPPNNGCNGGRSDYAFDWLVQQGAAGIATEESYPYLGFQSSCLNDSTVTGAAISNWTDISTNETEIAASLELLGPIAIAVNANGLQQYKRGIACPLADLCDPAMPNHAMLLVGWGVEDGQEYWKVSWAAYATAPSGALNKREARRLLFWKLCFCL
jgi:cathepsin F